MSVAKQLFKVIVPFYIPTSDMKVLVLHTLTNICYLLSVLFILTILLDVKWCVIVV